MEKYFNVIRNAMDEFGDEAGFVCFAIASNSEDCGTTVLKGSYQFARAAIAKFVSDILDAAPEDMHKAIVKDLCNIIKATDELKRKR